MTKNNLHLVTAGCSFTANEPTWANFLSKDLNATLHNVSRAGTGNHVISTNCIRKIEELKSQGIENIHVAIQWSGVYRFDRITESNKNLQTPIESLGNEYDWITDAAFQNRDKSTRQYWSSYYDNISLAQALNRTIEDILKLQWYLKSNNISYIMFSAWDLFHCMHVSRPGRFELILNGNQFRDADQYTNIESKTPDDISNLTSDLWNMIDWSHYWTFENVKINKGGMLQWIHNKLDKRNWYIRPGDYHPSHHAHKEFSRQIILPRIKDML